MSKTFGCYRKRINCPDCGKELIRLEPYEDGIFSYWCDDCDIDIEITKNNEKESN